MALYKRRTPWIGYIGFPVGLLLAMYYNLSLEKFLAIFVVSLLLLVRQLQWGRWG